MMWLPDGGRRLFKVIKTDEFEEVWEQIKVDLGRPDAIMVAIERGIARKPKETPPSFPFVEDDQRIVRFRDPSGGKEVWVFYRVNEEEWTCELGWAHVQDYEEPDEDE